MCKPWLTDDEKRSEKALETLHARWPELGFVDLDMCTEKDVSRHKVTLDGRFTTGQLREIIEAMDSLSVANCED
jgi:hypothetical protein